MNSVPVSANPVVIGMICRVNADAEKEKEFETASAVWRCVRFEFWIGLSL